MTTVSSVASVVMFPLNLAIYLNATGSTNIDIEYGPLSVAVAIVVCGIGAGLLASSKLPSRRHVFHTLANVAGLSLIVLGLASTSGSRGRPLQAQPWNFFVGCAAPCVFGIVLATASARTAGLTKPQVVSVGIETVYQNTALALSVALASPMPAHAAAVPVFYQATQVTTLFVYSVCAWKLGWTFAPRGRVRGTVHARHQLPAGVPEKQRARRGGARRGAGASHETPSSRRRRSGWRSHRGNAAVRSLKKMIASPATSRGNSVKGGSKTGAGLGVLNLGALFRGGSAELSGEERRSNRARARRRATWAGKGPSARARRRARCGASTRLRRNTGVRRARPAGWVWVWGWVTSRGKPRRRWGWDGTARRFPSPSRGPGGARRRGRRFPGRRSRRARALEELNIRVARQSTRKATYRDFANVLQGTANSAGSALAAARARGGGGGAHEPRRLVHLQRRQLARRIARGVRVRGLGAHLARRRSGCVREAERRQAQPRRARAGGRASRGKYVVYSRNIHDE